MSDNSITVTYNFGFKIKFQATNFKNYGFPD